MTLDRRSFSWLLNGCRPCVMAAKLGTAPISCGPAMESAPGNLFIAELRLTTLDYRV
jgi:hypothetical protein